MALFMIQCAATRGAALSSAGQEVMHSGNVHIPVAQWRVHQDNCSTLRRMG